MRVKGRVMDERMEYPHILQRGSRVMQTYCLCYGEKHDRTQGGSGATREVGTTMSWLGSVLTQGKLETYLR
ncbi:hypothetical protein SCLCIDRAFT_489010 [Scleroderma citrinum Foug A]|uniref:Uncharacterized protein n=1 Tax=Scleroderma citrinum Foug A TaxID=1036808 RepID=A0A0C3CW17_9AGAM|nr:hypothetical protein SCLCIDRAFT_489010 [Scleroderma citrinum Foug A]